MITRENEPRSFRWATDERIPAGQSLLPVRGALGRSDRPAGGRFSSAACRKPHRQCRFAVLRRLCCALFVVCCSVPSGAGVRSLEIFERSPFADGASFGSSGRYEILRGVAHFEVDPQHVRNEIIVDLDLAPRNARGRVTFEADVFMLAPADLSKANRAVFYDVNNRGGKVALRGINSAKPVNLPEKKADAGNGFLLRQGYTIVWCGWIGELLPGNDKLLLRPPVAEVGGKPIRGLVRQEMVTNEPVDSMPLSRRAGHGSYPPTPKGERTAQLSWRLRETDDRVPIPRDQWRLVSSPLRSVDRGVSGTLPEIRLHLSGGFQPGWIYELIYEAEGPIVQGLGFAATRDLISFLRYDNTAENPFRSDDNPAFEYAYGFGVSQSGRFLRDFVHLGFNVDEGGRRVFDGLIPHVAGAGLGFFNFRFAQPNRHNGQHEDHLFTADRFPFTYGTSTNPFTSETNGILLRTSTEDPALLPKIMHTQSTGEYWNRAGSLVHTDPLGREDASIPDNVRVYAFGGTQHSPAGWPSERGIGQNLLNPADYKPFLRALVTALDEWVRHGIEPPPSVYPRIDEGSLVTRDQSSTRFPSLPAVRYPLVIQQPHELDFGPGFRNGLLKVTPPRKIDDYTVLVPKCDRDGNEIGTLRPPEVAVPLATYTGWNLRHRDRGAENMLASLAGSFFPFPKTREDRVASGDPRASVEERYESFSAYREAFSKECERLVNRRYLLREDAERLCAGLTRYSSLFPKSWVVLSEDHISAVERHRRVVVNCDTISGDRSFGGSDPADLVERRFEFIDAQGTQIDSVWWDWGEGH